MCAPRDFLACAAAGSPHLIKDSLAQQVAGIQGVISGLAADLVLLSPSSPAECMINILVEGRRPIR